MGRDGSGILEGPPVPPGRMIHVWLEPANICGVELEDLATMNETISVLMVAPELAAWRTRGAAGRFSRKISTCRRIYQARRQAPSDEYHPRKPFCLFLLFELRGLNVDHKCS